MNPKPERSESQEVIVTQQISEEGRYFGKIVPADTVAKNQCEDPRKQITEAVHQHDCQLPFTPHWTQ